MCGEFFASYLKEAAEFAYRSLRVAFGRSNTHTCKTRRGYLCHAQIAESSTPSRSTLDRTSPPSHRSDNKTTNVSCSSGPCIDGVGRFNEALNLDVTDLDAQRGWFPSIAAKDPSTNIPVARFHTRTPAPVLG